MKNKFNNLKYWQKGGIMAILIQIFLVILTLIFLLLGLFYSGFLLILNFMLELLSIFFYPVRFFLSEGFMGDLLSVIINIVFYFLIGAIIGEIFWLIKKKRMENE